MTHGSRVFVLLLALTASVPARAIDLAGGRLRGEVRTPALKPIVGATVIGVRTEAPPLLALTATNDLGLISVDTVPSGTWRVIVTAPGFQIGKVDNLVIGGPYRAVADLTLSPGEPNVPVLALPKGTGDPGVTVRVVGLDRKALSGVRVRIEPLDVRADPLRTETDADGTARLAGVPPGKWRVVLSRAGWTRLAVPSIELGGGDLTILARLLPLADNATLPVDELLPPARLIP